ncbi:hypothetical protein [Moritella yayanosii]|uniref:Uncharacterized protein n=1 Tax=Moritella yayanosii TaxID=69539 RepID=A0A330LK44_9GAMM|nr:hypothetical protein [Moritella yayanosii]SQD76626.1 protein of unknown function [Moritella yayanosii]
MPSRDLANRFSITLESGKTVFVTVDPYNGDILGTIVRSSWRRVLHYIRGDVSVLNKCR